MSDESERDAMRRYTETGLLIIDEIAASQTCSDSEVGLITEIIDQRYSNQRPMIILGNVRPSELPKYLGDRAVDRLREVAATATEFSGNSYRDRRTVK